MAVRFRILAASDGSPSAHAALAAALEFPWPRASRARAVVALGRNPPALRGVLKAASVRALHEQLEPARRLLARRWPDADAVALHDTPADAILAEARRFRADAIALGWRGEGAIRRLVAGSVSRAVVARTRIPVLVVRAGVERVRRFVVGFDGSAQAKRAVRFLARLDPPRGGLAVVVTATEPLWVPRVTRRLPSDMRASLRGEALRFNRKQRRLAEAQADAAAAILRRGGWSAKVEVRAGAPLETLLEACSDLRGDVLAVGARGAAGFTLPGSVATGALNHARIPVLVVP